LPAEQPSRAIPGNEKNERKVSAAEFGDDSSHHLKKLINNSTFSPETTAAFQIVILASPLKAVHVGYVFFGQ